MYKVTYKQVLYVILVVVNKHNTARVASCWFIIYYRLVMHGNSNVKLLRSFHPQNILGYACNVLF